MMKIKSLVMLILAVLSFIFFSCHDRNIKEYNKIEINKGNKINNDTIEKIRIPTH